MAHACGAPVLWDLAHAVGNVPLRLHDWHVDAAVWCNYKFVNGGPGAVGSLFIHTTHLHRTDLTQYVLPSRRCRAPVSSRHSLWGWWGNEPTTKFSMRDGAPPSPQPLRLTLAARV